MYSELQKREPRKDNSKVTLWFPLELIFVLGEFESTCAVGLIAPLRNGFFQLASISSQKKLRQGLSHR